MARPKLVESVVISGDRVRVFVSHSHEDHCDPVILGWQAAEDPANHHLLGPCASYSEDGLEILILNSRHSGVPELACLMKLDGLVVYHDGDDRMDDKTDCPYLQQHAEAGARMYREIADAFEPRIPGLSSEMQGRRGERFEYRDGQVRPR